LCTRAQNINISLLLFQIYLDQDIWIGIESYALVVNSSTPSIFVGDMLIILFSRETLQESTLTDRQNNRQKKKIQIELKKFDPKRIIALRGKQSLKHIFINQRN